MLEYNLCVVNRDAKHSLVNQSAKISIVVGLLLVSVLLASCTGHGLVLDGDHTQGVSQDDKTGCPIFFQGIKIAQSANFTNLKNSVDDLFLDDS